MYIYLDTNIWNALCGQNIDPKSLVTALAAKSSTIVFGSHNVFELAKTFMPGTEEAKTRGTQLFAYVAQFLDLGIPMIRENMETLQLEAHAFGAGGGFVNPFLSGDDYMSVRQEVGKLAAGTVEGKVKEFLAARTQFAKDTRSDQIDHFVQHPDVKDALKAITAEQLPDWLRKETSSYQGPKMLRGHLLRQGVTHLSPDATAGLLSAHGKCCRAVIYADLYSNWRCANRDSNRKDLIDNMLHVLQAIYCDIYATEEAAQREYAEYLLTNETRIAIYDRQTPVDQWLLSLVSD